MHEALELIVQLLFACLADYILLAVQPCKVQPFIALVLSGCSFSRTLAFFFLAPLSFDERGGDCGGVIIIWSFC